LHSMLNLFHHILISFWII